MTDLLPHTAAGHQPVGLMFAAPKQARHLSKDELLKKARAILPAPVESLSQEQIWELMTVTQYLTDLCLNETERRGNLTYSGMSLGGEWPGPDGAPIVPYHCDEMLETILTRKK